MRVARGAPLVIGPPRLTSTSSRIAEPQPSDYYPATIVSYKSSNRKYKFIIHFDDLFADGSSAEFYPTTFKMSSLADGWHRLTVTGAEDVTTYYVDGVKVGEVCRRTLFQFLKKHRAKHYLR